MARVLRTAAMEDVWSKGMRNGMDTCVWRRVREGIYAPGCLGGVLTDMSLILKPHYDYCPFCGSRARYGKNSITELMIRRRAEIRRLG